MIVTKIQQMDIRNCDGFMLDVGPTYTWRPQQVTEYKIELNKFPSDSQQDEFQKDFYSVRI